MGYSINITISLVILMGTIVVIYLVLEIRKLCGRSQEEDMRTISYSAVVLEDVSYVSADSTETTLNLDALSDGSLFGEQYARLEIDKHIKTNIWNNSYSMEKDVVTIGRRADNDIAIYDPIVSRRHCVITYENGIYFIEDLGSMNGTFVNGKKILQKSCLDRSCKIVIGNARIHFNALDS